MTASKAKLDEEALRMVQVEERLLSSLGSAEGKIVHALAEAWGVESRTVRQYVDKVRARWKAEAQTIQDRAERRHVVRKSIEDAAYEARAEGKHQVQLNALRMLMDLDGLTAAKELELTIKPAPSDDTPERIAADAIELLTEEQRAELIRRLGGGQ